MNKPVNAAGAPAAVGPYSHGVLAGNLFFSSGQIPLVPETGKIIEGGIESQAGQVLKNLEAVLAAAGFGFGDVVKTTIFLTDLADFQTVNKIYASRFPSDPPARSTVQVAALPVGAHIEIEVVACR